MKVLMLLAASLIGIGTAAAQTPAVPTSQVLFDVAGPDLATVGAYTYRVYADGGPVGSPLPLVTCSGAASPFTCAAPFPAFTPGSHSVTLTAANLAGESAKSAAFGFVFVVTPSVPGNLRIK